MSESTREDSAQGLSRFGMVWQLRIAHALFYFKHAAHGSIRVQDLVLVDWHVTFNSRARRLLVYFSLAPQAAESELVTLT